MKSKSSKRGAVRIIGGKWRHRRLPVVEGTRPTPDAVRETLFNWLMPLVPGACCLDLFAGTGALGFEALSRGAAWVDMIEGSLQAVERLREQARVFNTQTMAVYPLKLPEALDQLPVKYYDLVFIDAPFRKNLLLPCCRWLEAHDRLAIGAHLYLEMEKESFPLAVPADWTLWRSKVAGQVAYCLYKK